MDPRALLWAAHNSNVEIARALIAAKAAVDTPNDFGVTPLLEASRNGDAAMVDLLLRSGADPKRSHPRVRRRCSARRAQGASRPCACCSRAAPT